MADAIGKNTPNAERLRSFVDRIERLDAEKKAPTEDRKLIVAEAVAAGFNMKQGINPILRERKMKPHDRQDAIATRDIYMHAMGMDSEPPLFRQIAAFANDALAADKLVEAFKLLVPPGGEIILKIGGKPLRLWRDKDGEPKAEECLPPEVVENVRKGHAFARQAPKDVPDVSAAEADAMGERAAKENVPVIENPFPFGDPRRAHFDEGWRRGAGNNGMGG